MSAGFDTFLVGLSVGLFSGVVPMAMLAIHINNNWFRRCEELNKSWHQIAKENNERWFNTLQNLRTK